MYLRIVTAPAAEPVTVSDFKAHARIDVSDEDDLIEALVMAAREQTELVSRRALITQTLALTLDSWPGCAIDIPRPPLQSVSSIGYTDTAGDAQTLASDQYVVQTARERLVLADGASWPDRLARSVITVTFVAGYGDAADDVPERYRQAILLLAAHWYEHRETGSDMPVYDVPLAFDSLVMTDRAY